MRNHVFASNLKEGLLKLMALALHEQVLRPGGKQQITTNHYRLPPCPSPRPSPHGNDEMKLRILIFLDLVSWHCLQDQLPAYVSPNLEGFHVPTWKNAKLRARPARGIPHIETVGTWRRQSKKWCWSHWRGSKYLLCQSSFFVWKFTRYDIMCFVLFFGPGHGDSRTKGNLKKCISCFKSYAKIVDHFDPFWDQKTQHILDQKGLYVQQILENCGNHFSLAGHRLHL